MLKHILLKKEHDLLFFQFFVSKHFYEDFFLILMYVFVNLKSKKKRFRLQNLFSFFQIERLFSLKTFEQKKMEIPFFDFIFFQLNEQILQKFLDHKLKIVLKLFDLIKFVNFLRNIKIHYN